MRLVLRKSMFGPLKEQPAPLHAPIAERTSGDGQHLVLLQSTTNPRVRRWRQVTKQAKVFYSEKARLVLREASRTGAIYITRRRLEDPEIHELVSHGMIEIHQEPRHHATEYRAALTKAGREYIRRMDQNVDDLARASQTTMFKGRRVRLLLRKAMPVPSNQASVHGIQGHAPPQSRGLVLRQSKTGQAKRWQRTGEPVKTSSEHVRYRHPDTGEERTGQVVSGGAKGITVADHETGKTAKLLHGEYVSSEPPNAKAEPAKPKPAATAEPAGEDYRAKYPGLNKYPPKGVKPDEGGKDDDWKLRWRSPETGKMVQGYETAYLRENARQKFHRINAVGGRIGELRSTLDTHLDMHPESPAAVKAAMVKLVDHTAMRAGNESSMAQGVHGVSTLLKKHVKVTGDTVHLSYVGKSSVPQEHTVTDPKLAAVIRHQLTLPGDRLFQAKDGGGKLAPVKADHVNDYVSTHLGEEHTLKDLRTFHATRLFSEAADKLGPPQKGEDPDEKIKTAAMEVAKHLGHKKALKRGHFAVHDEGGINMEPVAKHGGKLYMHGKRRAVGFHTAADRKAYQKATGAGELPKGEHPDVEAEWQHEPQTSLDNYIDPTVVQAYRHGLTLSGSLKKAVEAAGDGLSVDERRFIHYLGKVRELDPYKFRGAQP